MKKLKQAFKNSAKFPVTLNSKEAWGCSEGNLFKFQTFPGGEIPHLMEDWAFSPPREDRVFNTEFSTYEGGQKYFYSCSCGKRHVGYVIIQ